MIADESRTRSASLLKRWKESADSCAGDLRALSAESASWEELDREQIAAHATRALADTLELEFAAVQFNDASGVEIIQTSASNAKSGELSAELHQALRDLDREAYTWPAGGVIDWQSSSGGPVMRIVRIPIGLRDEGWVFASSITEAFPTDSEFVILTACATQIAVALQAWRSRLARRDEGMYLQQYSKNSPDALWIISVNTMKIEYISSAFSRIWGKKSESMLVTIDNWLDTISERDRPSAIYALNAAINGEIVAQNYSITTSRVSSRLIRHVLFPIRDDQGRVTHVGGAAEDVTMTADIQVYVLGTDVTSRESVGALLRANGFTVKLFTSSRVFLEAAPVLVPGCLILERRGTEAMGLRVVTELKARGIDMPIIVVDKSRGGVGVAVTAMKAGATDWLEAPYAEAELVAAVASALAGVQIQRDAGHATKIARSRLAKMTPREREVLLGLVAGETNKEIARRLAISPRTVESHRARVMERLGTKTLSEAVLLAASTGLL